MARTTHEAEIKFFQTGLEDVAKDVQDISSNINLSGNIDTAGLDTKIQEALALLQIQAEKGILNLDDIGFDKLREMILEILDQIDADIAGGIITNEAIEKIKEQRVKLEDELRIIQDIISNLETEKISFEGKGKEREASKAAGFGKTMTVEQISKGKSNLESKDKLTEKEKERLAKYNAYMAEYKRLAEEEAQIDIKLTEAKQLEQDKRAEIELNMQQESTERMKDPNKKDTAKARNIIEQLKFEKEKIKVQQNAERELEKQRKAQQKLNDAMNQGGESFAENAVKATGYYFILRQLRQLMRQVVTTISELDKAFTTVAMVTDLNREQSLKLLKSYQSIAREAGLATDEVANLSVYFFRQGRSAKDALQLTEVAAKSARVAGISAADAADYLTSAVNGFNLAASQAGEVADRFAKLAASAAVSFEELAVAMQKVAPTAKSAGISIDFMMGVLAKGIETTREAPENIGTAFKTIFARMREITDMGKAVEDGMDLNRVEKALLSVGVTLRTAEGQFRNLEDVLIEVGYKWENLTSIEQAYLATALAGTRQQPRLLAIFNDFGRTIELINTSREATDSMAMQHYEYMQGMEAALTQLKIAWESVITAISSSELIIGLFNGVAQTLSKVSTILSSIADSTTLTLGVLALTVVSLGKIAVQKMVNIGLERQEQVERLKTYGINTLYNGSIASTTAIMWKKVVAIVAEMKAQKSSNIVTAQKLILDKLYLKGTYANILATILSTIATYGLATAVMVATLGIPLLIGAVVGLVGAFIKMAKSSDDASNATSSMGGLISEIVGVFKEIFIVVKEAFLALFNLGKVIGEVIAVLILLSLKGMKMFKVFDYVRVMFKGLKASFKAVGLLVKLLARFFVNLSNKVQEFIEKNKVLKTSLDAVGSVFRFFGDVFDWISDSIDNYSKTLRTVPEIAGDIKETRKQFSELANQKKSLTDLVNEYKKLNDQVVKTPEDIERMNELLGEFSQYEIDGKKVNLTTVSATGDIELDEESFSGLVEDIDDKLDTMSQTISDDISAAVKIDGANAFNNKEILAAAQSLGYDFGVEYSNSIVESLDANDKDIGNKLQGSIANIANMLNPASFVKKIGKKDIFDLDGMEAAMATIIDSIKEFYIDVSNAEEDLNPESETFYQDLAKARYNAFQEAYNRINADTSLTPQQKKDMILALESSLPDQAGINKLVNESGISLDLVGAMMSRGMDTAKTAQVLKDNLIPLLEELEAMGADTNILENAFGDLALGNDVQSALETIRNQLELMGYSGDELRQKMIQVFNAMNFKGSTNLAKEIASIRSDITGLFDIEKAFKEGDMEAISRYAEKFGGDIVDKLIAGEDVSSAFNDILDKTRNDINNEILATEELLALTTDEDQRTLLENELYALRTMQTYYESMTAAQMQRNSEIERAQRLISETNDLYKTQVDLIEMGISSDNPLYNLISDLIDYNKNRLLSDIRSAFSTDTAEFNNLRDQLIATGAVFTDAFSVDPDTINESNRALYTTFQAATDRIIESSETYLDYLSSETSRIKKEYDDRIKAIEESTDAEIDAINEMMDRRWSDIDYQNELLDIEEEIIDARNKLIGLSLESVGSSQIKSLEKDLRRLREERRKIIEEEMVAQAERTLQEERDKVIARLTAEQTTALQGLADELESFGDMLDTYSNSVANNTQAVVANTDAVIANTGTPVPRLAPEPTRTTANPRAGGAGASGSAIALYLERG